MDGEQGTIENPKETTRNVSLAKSRTARDPKRAGFRRSEIGDSIDDEYITNVAMLDVGGRQLTNELILLVISGILGIILFILATIAAGTNHFYGRVQSGPSMLGGFPTRVGYSPFLWLALATAVCTILWSQFLVRNAIAGKATYLEFCGGAVLWLLILLSWALVAMFELFFTARLYPVLASSATKHFISKVNLCGFYDVQEASMLGLKMNSSLRRAYDTVSLEQRIVATAFCLLVVWSIFLIRRGFKARQHFTSTVKRKSFKSERLQLILCSLFSFCSIIVLCLAPCFPHCSFTARDNITDCVVFAVATHAMVLLVCIYWAVHLHVVSKDKHTKYHSSIKAALAVLMTSLSAVSWG
jgi:hypothetical protein